MSALPECLCSGPLPILVSSRLPLSFGAKALLYGFTLLPAVPERVLALCISCTVLALPCVGFLAKQVSASFADPVNHAAAAELVAAALALRVAVAFQCFDGGVAIGTGLVDFEGEGLCFPVDCFLAFTVLVAALVDVLGAIAVGADLEVAVLAGEDSAVSLAVVVLVGLEGVFAAVHACHAFSTLR